ncbi:MAG: class I SAM-dependent methyltransferase [Candidatus Micrarchaeota archaeon]
MKEYDAIAEDWNRHRSRPISALALFIGEVRKGDVVLDAGCGNARNLVEIARRCRRAVGVDSSENMLSYAAKRLGEAGLGKKVVLEQADLLVLPFGGGEFDKVFCLAVLHHLPRKEQLKAMRSLSRVLKPGGRLYISVWNRDQKKFDGRGKEVNGPWRTADGTRVARYYYLFSDKELMLLARRSGLKVERTVYEKDAEEHGKRGAKNLCMALSKPTV